MRPKGILLQTGSSLLLPGLGQLLLGSRAAGAFLSVSFLAGLGLALVHLLSGLRIFESTLGSYLFGALLRALALLWAFAALDTYLRRTQQGNATRRLAVLANLLVPGAGYLLARAWLRAASSLLLLVALLYFARLPSRALDYIYLGFQAITAVGVYHQLAMAEFEARRDLPTPAPATQVPAIQILLLIQLMTAAVLFGWFVQLRLIDYDRFRIGADDVKVTREDGALHVALPSHGLSLAITGRGWQRGKAGDGSIFRTRHELGATLLLGVEPILPFVRPDAYLRSLRRRMTEQGYRVQNEKTLALSGYSARQLHVSRKLAGDMTVDRWAVAIPRGHEAILLLLSCGRETCQKLLPSLEKTRDSLRLR